MRPGGRKALEVLRESQLWLTPNNIAKNAGYSAGYIRDELTKALEDGLVEKDAGPGDPFYRITEDGKEFLDAQNNNS